MIVNLQASELTNSAQFDAFMRSLPQDEKVEIHSGPEVFWTAGTREWGDTNDIQQNRGWRFGRNWTWDSDGTTLAWDVDAVPDSDIDDTQNWLLCSIEARFDARLNQHTPEEVWNLLPRGQKVYGLHFDLQFAKALPRWQAKNEKLRIGAGVLAGHQGAFERCHATNYGSWNYEGFPFYIQGGLGMYDRNRIAQTDPATHIFDAGVPDSECAHISGCTVNGYVEASNDQVSAFFIQGNVGEKAPGVWVQHMRAYAYQTGNNVMATGSNKVQAHTIYQCLRGLVARNTAVCEVGYYGDSYTTKGVEIDDNDFTGYYAVQLQLSPTSPDAEHTSHEGYTIGAKNRFHSRGADIKLDTLGPETDTRYIRGIVNNYGASVEGQPTPKPKRGCLFSFL